MPDISRDKLASIATGRRSDLFAPDLEILRDEITRQLQGSRLLVIGGAGSIGAATVAELSSFPVAALHVVDQNENGLTELVRDLRSRPAGLNVADFRTLPLDFGSPIMERLLNDEAPYHYVLNFAAIKHVRSEKDAYSLLQMFATNVCKPDRLLGRLIAKGGTRRYFCVSTDKAANPVNLMGASKRVMEHVIFSDRGASSSPLEATSARFANVAFSDGSLLDGWLRRFEKRQPLAVPRSTKRFFISLREAGQLCMIAAICAPNRHIVIPRLQPEVDLHDLEQIAREVIRAAGFEPADTESETRAREEMDALMLRGRYPLLLTPLDTSGEKPFEEFVGEGETAREIGLPNLLAIPYLPPIAHMEPALLNLQQIIDGGEATPSKADLVARLRLLLPELDHNDASKQLDHRM